MLLKFVTWLFLKYNKENPMHAIFNIIFISASLVNSYYLPKYYGILFNIFNKDIDKFLMAVLYILILNGLVYAISEFEEYYLTIQKNKIEELTNKIIIDKIKEKFIGNQEEIIIGEKVAVLTKFKDVIGLWYQYTIHYIIPYTITIIAFLWYLSKHDYILSILLVTFLGGSTALLFANSKLCYKKCSTSIDVYMTKYQELEDYLSNLLTIHTYNEFKNEDANLKNKSDEYVLHTNISNKCTLKWCLIGTISVMLFLILLMYRSNYLLQNNIITKSTFLSIYFIGAGLVHTLIYLNDTLQDVSKEYIALETIEKNSKLDIFKILNNENSKQSDVYNIKTDSLIAIRNLEYRYNQSSEPIIKDLNLDIKNGERIALVGDIGTGKSTIMKIILGLVKPTKGDLYLEGINYKNLEQTGIFKRFGYMTQNPVLFNRSILDNILFGNQNVKREEVVALLEKFDLNVVFNRLKNGIDTPVGKNGSKLSGGQRQVIWFLRIYLHNPDILLMDEPTASLSKESKEQLWKLIKEGFAGKTIIMASHDEFLIKMATRKVTLGGFRQNE
jgi:ABC-type bacteriocin/lantibiotic exporter with double-glycine peptidase domain